jgi:NTP pyrophosphatase (non-canonical NTP hydrolase)
MNINIDKINEKLASFVKEREWSHYHTPKNLAIALSIEANELLEHFQWRENETSQVVKENETLMQGIEEEIADVLIYLVRLASILQIDLAQVVDNKFILNEIKYPVAESKGEFVKYSQREKN